MLKITQEGMDHAKLKWCKDIYYVRQRQPQGLSSNLMLPRIFPFRSFCLQKDRAPNYQGVQRPCCHCKLRYTENKCLDLLGKLVGYWVAKTPGPLAQRLD